MFTVVWVRPYAHYGAYIISWFLPGAVRSIAYARSRLVAGITGLNPATGMDVRMLCFLCTVCVLLRKFVARVGRVIRPPRATKSKGRQNKYVNWGKKIDILRSTDFKLLRQINRN